MTIICGTQWIFVAHHEDNGISFDEYVSADGTRCKQVWHDGYTEKKEKG